MSRIRCSSSGTQNLVPTPDPVDSFSGLDETVYIDARRRRSDRARSCCRTSPRATSSASSSRRSRSKMGSATSARRGCKNLAMFVANVKPLLASNNCSTQLPHGGAPTAGLKWDTTPDAALCVGGAERDQHDHPGPVAASAAAGSGAEQRPPAEDQSVHCLFDGRYQLDQRGKVNGARTDHAQEHHQESGRVRRSRRAERLPRRSAHRHGLGDGHRNGRWNWYRLRHGHGDGHRHGQRRHRHGHAGAGSEPGGAADRLRSGAAHRGGQAGRRAADARRAGRRSPTRRRTRRSSTSTSPIRASRCRSRRTTAT